MSTENYFPQRPQVGPQIYGYIIPGLKDHEGYIKVGYTDRTAEERIKEQTHAAAVKYKILFVESAMLNDGDNFTDKDVHRILRRKGYQNLNYGEDKNEWFKCSKETILSAITELRTGQRQDADRYQTFSMRPEQARIVGETKNYFERIVKYDSKYVPKYLWNCKMRFGKTFASYQLAKQMGFKRILILTFKPAVESAWWEDITYHVDFDGWQFVSNKDANDLGISIDEQYRRTNKKKPIVVFGSFQDLLGTNESGGIKTKNEFIHETNWDLVIFDEYHFGAWRENARKLFEFEDEGEAVDFDLEKYQKEEAGNAINESFLPITSSHYLYLSGTPFRALNNGEFIEEQISSWTYSDEQRAKEEWQGSGENPYAALPKMVMMTYKVPDSISQIAKEGETDEFDLNYFFEAEMTVKNKPQTAVFKHEEYVQRWLDLIRGSYMPTEKDNLKLGQNKRPPMPFSHTELSNLLLHTLWFLPNVASCYAMANLLNAKRNVFYHDFKIVVAAGAQAGIGLAALSPVRAAMDEPLKTKSITLSCGKLTTGVTVKPWTGIFMLRNLGSPETYFQAAFRVQSPWVLKDEHGQDQIMKQTCYIFDFAIDRALKQVSEYSCKLGNGMESAEKKVENFVKFLPVLAYDGSSMKVVDAQEILDYTLSGTSATLLAKRWESALLVNVDNDTLQRLLANQDAMDALMRIEGFRNLNKDLTTIINRAEHVKKLRKKDNLTPKEKKELTEAEKEYKSKRKEIQEKLIKFATRVPVFMYLTDYREEELKDVIIQLEPGLFKKVTGLNTKDFELLCSLNVFNAGLMNEAIFKFKRYEDSSLVYTGLDTHGSDTIGGWDIKIKKTDYERLFKGQQESMGGVVVEKKAEAVATTRKEFGMVKRIVKVVTPKPIIELHLKQTFDMNRVHVGDIVIHKKFGEGTIVEITDKKDYVYVEFESGKKTMSCPFVFENGLLTLIEKRILK